MEYRKKLYDNYVSKFKKTPRTLEISEINQFFQVYHHRYLPSLVDIGFNCKILEVGCGPGLLLAFLKNYGFGNLTGLDISVEQAEIARGYGLTIHVADVFDFLENRPEEFDVIIAIDFIEHFNKNELSDLMKLFYQALTKNGLLILQTPNGEGLFSRSIMYGDLTHETILTESSLQQLLLTFDFQNIVFNEIPPVSKNTAGKIRLILWKFIRIMAIIIKRICTSKNQNLWTENLLVRCHK